MEERYYSLNRYLRETFGEKVYKLALDGGMTCPNRDGKIGTGGCIFCSAGGSGDFAEGRRSSVGEQIARAKERVRGKTDAAKFIAYFQSCYEMTFVKWKYLPKCNNSPRISARSRDGEELGIGHSVIRGLDTTGQWSAWSSTV